jgi:hypothetical protein
MNLVSCEGCGIVVDLNRRSFDQEIYDQDGSVIDGKAAWNGDRYVPTIPCPVCGEDIADPAWER